MAIGMHLRLPLRDPLWRLPLRLGFPAMLATAALVAAPAFSGAASPSGRR
jgi:hypothetical protein